MENNHIFSEAELQELKRPKVKPIGYVVFFLSLMFFSGLMQKLPNWANWFDFLTLNGKFGIDLTGSGGNGVRQAWLISLSVIPGCAFATGMIYVIEGLGGLKAGQRVLNAVLKPIIGIPGWCSLSAIAHLFASTDSGAVMTLQLRQNHMITDKELGIYGIFQFVAPCYLGRTLVFAIYAAGISAAGIPLIYLLAIGLFAKILGANLMRLYIKFFDKEVEVI